jgi:hypothetical protein
MYATLSEYTSFVSVKKENYNESVDGAFMYIYIGKLRDYMKESIEQIRLWNPASPIYVCVSNLEENKQFIEQFKEYNVRIIYLEELQATEHHKQFQQRYTNTSLNQFWKYAMERFFYVEECMKEHNISNVFHLEFDNMLYFSLEELKNLCSIKQKMLVPSDNETRFIAGTCFIPSHYILSKLNIFFATHASTENEMEMMMKFYKNNGDVFECLPIIPPNYPYTLTPIEGDLVTNPERLFNSVPYFKGVFDAAGIGQYMGGVDPIHNSNNTDGFVTPHCAFRVDSVYFLWKKENKLYRPYISVDQTTWYPIFNLHIHNKHMTRWLSSTQKTQHLSNITVE